MSRDGDREDYRGSKGRYCSPQKGAPDRVRRDEREAEEVKIEALVAKT